jgi:hypothetical protein
MRPWYRRNLGAVRQSWEESSYDVGYFTHCLSPCSSSDPKLASATPAKKLAPYTNA